MATKSKSIKPKLRPEIYRSRKNKLYYATLISVHNGKQVWKTGDGYDRIRDAHNAINMLKSPNIETEVMYIGYKR